MNSNVSSYNLATIRDLLEAAFNEKTLRRFCQDHPRFRGILTRFSASDSLADLVDKVMGYCGEFLLWDELLAEVNEFNTRQYQRFETHLQASIYSTQAQPVEKAKEERIPLRESIPITSLHLSTSPFGARPADLQRAFDNLIADKTDGFVGREFVFHSIAQFLKDKPRGYFLIRGDPGIGKSALAAQLVKKCQCVHHFNIRAEGINKTEQFLGNICAQLISAYQLERPFLPSRALEDAGFMNELLGEISDKRPSGKKVIIVVDALDEASIQAEANILCLPKTLPEGVYIIATMRRVDVPFSIECEQETLDIVHDSTNNLCDIREYIAIRVISKGIRAYITAQEIDAESFVEHVVEKSEGNFMYLHYVLPEIERGVYNDLRVEDLPRGLEGYYEDHWRRMGMMAKPLPRVKIRIVYILSEVQHPVSRKLIAQFADSSDMQVDELMVQSVLDEWDQFLHKHPTAESICYAVYHTSFRDFLHRKDIVRASDVTTQGIHALIADDLWNELFGNE